MYSLTDQILIVAPKQTDIRALLLKYSSLFGIVIAGTLSIFALAPLFSSHTAIEAAPMIATRETSGAGLSQQKPWQTRALFRRYHLISHLLSSVVGCLLSLSCSATRHISGKRNDKQSRGQTSFFKYWSPRLRQYAT